MPTRLHLSACLLALAACCLAPASAASKSDTAAEAKARQAQRHAQIDRSGKTRRGKASYYSRRFAGKKMADGDPMNPNANVAASKTLPLGTRARVKNLNTGKSTTVEVKDRGPYVEGRVIDLSPKAASELGMKKQGVAPVEVEPIEVPQPGGRPAPQQKR